MKAFESQLEWNQQQKEEDADSVKTGNSGMALLDHIMVEGYLLGQPKAYQTKNGKDVAVFSILNRYNKETVSFFDIETWGWIAKKCSNFVKGTHVIIVGKLRQDRWETEKGEKKSKIKIVAQNIIEVPKRLQEAVKTEELKAS